MKFLALALASTTFAASPLLAQAASSPAADAQAAPAASAGATAPASGAPNVTAGAQVSDASGGAVGTVESVSGGNAVVSTGAAKAALPLTAFAQGPNGLVIGMSKADLEAAVAKATGGAQTASTGAAGGGQSAAATTPASFKVGATVSDPQGGKVGTVAAVSGNLVTVATANAKAQLPKTAFAQSPTGLIIAMTATELEAAAKSAAKGGG